MTGLSYWLHFSPFPEAWPGFQGAESFVAGTAVRPYSDCQDLVLA